MLKNLKRYTLKVYDFFFFLLFISSGQGLSNAVKLMGFRNKFKNKRCFIIGNGPSLAKMDLSFLKDEYSFGLNRIYLLFNKLNFTTTFLVSVNNNVIKQFAKDFEKLDCDKFFSWRNRKKIVPSKNTYFIRSRIFPGFSKNPAYGAWEGSTVTFVAMQLAYYMGFKEVILIGVDHNFKSKGKAHKLVTSRGKDMNHFDPNYFGKGVKWQLPDLGASEIAYKMARSVFEEDKRKILDATVNGKLKVFKKVEYKKLFSNK